MRRDFRTGQLLKVAERVHAKTMFSGDFSPPAATQSETPPKQKSFPDPDDGV